MCARVCRGGTRPSFACYTCVCVCKVLIPMPCKKRGGIYFGGRDEWEEEEEYRVAGTIRQY